MVQIKWTKRALGNLHEIYDFIAKDSPRYAQLQIERIQEAVLKLVEFPSMGRIMSEFPNLSYREILVGNYRVLYRTDEEKDRILVMSVVHCRRSVNKTPDKR